MFFKPFSYCAKYSSYHEKTYVMLIFVKTSSTSFYYFSFESYSIFDGENEQKISFFLLLQKLEPGGLFHSKRNKGIWSLGPRTYLILAKVST